MSASASLFPFRCGSSSDGGGVGGGGADGGRPGGGSGPCGACKFLRRKCLQDCIFAPYFNSEQGAAHFATVHKVFGASNVTKLLRHLPVHRRMDAVVTVVYEAQARLRDPVYGCVAHIFTLQQQVTNLQAEIANMQAHQATLQVPTPPPPPSQPITVPSSLSMADLHSNILPSTLELSSLVNPMGLQQPTIVHSRFSCNQGQPRPMPISTSTSASVDLQALAREFLQRQGSGSFGSHMPHNGRSSVAKSD